MNYDRVSATIGIRAVDPRMLADDKFLKRMGNFERVCKQIDAKHDHVMEMLANIQEQLRKLEMKQRKERGAQFQIHTTAFKPPYLPVSRPQEIEVESKILPPNQCLSSLSYGSNDTEPEIEGCVEVLKHAPTISAVVVEIDFFTTKAAKIHAPKVFDEIPESKKSKISVMPPLVRGSEIAEVYDFGVSNLQFQTPHVSTQEIKMEFDCLSLIPSPSSFSPSSNGTKLEDEGLVEVPIHTIVAESQLQESESEFEWSENFPILSLPKFTPSWRIMVSSLLHLPFLYNCYNGDGLTKEELKWLDTGQYLVVSDFSRDGVGFDLIACWNLMNEMCWDKNTLVSGMQLKDSWSEWGEIKIVVRGANNHEQNSGALRIQELVDCMSLYVMNFTFLAFAYDPGIYCMCWNESLVHFLKIQLDNSATSNHKIGLYGVKMVNNVSIFHNSLANPTVGLEDAMPLHEISSLHLVCCPTKHVTSSRGIRCKNRKKEMRWYLMAFNGHLHYSDVFFKPSKHQLLKCVMNDGPSWSVKVLNSSEEKAVEQRHVLEVLDDISPKQLGVKIKELENCGVWRIVVFGSTYDLHAHTYKCGVWRFREFHSKFFRIIQGVLSWKKVGEAFGGLGLDQLLTVWLRISLGNEHMIQNSHAGKDPVIVPTCQRPPSKPPFQFLHLSLGDKTHSRGEYCHVHGYGGIGNKDRRREINGSVGVLIMLGLDLIVYCGIMHFMVCNGLFALDS